MSGKGSILVVDDNVDICEVIKDWLEDEDFKVDVAYSGNKALLKIQNNDYDVILTDVKMPDGSGIDLLNGIKEYNKKIQMIVMMTGFTDIEEEEFYQYGATHFFKKPLKLELLTQLIEANVVK